MYALYRTGFVTTDDEVLLLIMAKLRIKCLIDSKVANEKSYTHKLGLCIGFRSSHLIVAHINSM